MHVKTEPNSFKISLHISQVIGLTVVIVLLYHPSVKY